MKLQGDQLERALCRLAGEDGHRQCGICHDHRQPRAVCGCLATRPLPGVDHITTDRGVTYRAGDRVRPYKRTDLPPTARGTVLYASSSSIVAVHWDHDEEARFESLENTDFLVHEDSR